MRRATAAMLILLSGSQGLACPANLNGQFPIAQSNDAYPVFDLTQDGYKISGSVRLRDAYGVVSGTAENQRVDVVVIWQGNHKGRYTWSIDDNGAMKNGTAIDLGGTGSKIELSSKENFCR